MCDAFANCHGGSYLSVNPRKSFRLYGKVPTHAYPLVFLTARWSSELP